MKKFNKVSAIVLAVVSLLTCVAMHLNVLVMPMVIVSAVVSITVAFAAMLQTVHYREWHEYNPSKFWFVYSAICSAILVISFYFNGFGIIKQFPTAEFGFGFTTVPVFGVFIGEAYRAIILNEKSAIY